MQFRVRLLRYRGQSLPWQEVVNGPSFVGDLRTHLINCRGGQFRVATLFSDAPIEGSIVPALYEPMLDGFATLAFRLRGFERHEIRGGGFYSVVQEWHVDLPP